MKVMKALGLLSLTYLASCGQADKSPAFPSEVQQKSSSPDVSTVIVKNNVTLLDQTHKIIFDELPLEGNVDTSKRFWSGDHWPMNLGNINRRWNTSMQEGFDTVSPLQEEAKVMTEEDISRLAPSEKYDLFMGKYDYPLKKEVTTKASLTAVYWEGIGNGWASASSNHNEPIPKVVVNPDGISIPFGSSDIKALISYYYAFSKNLPPTLHLGFRCQTAAEDNSSPEGCTGDDLNPATFHILLTNRIGIRKESFLADIDPYHEVWNHPFQAYRSEVIDSFAPEEDAPDGTLKTLSIRTRISYVNTSEKNSWGPIKGSYKQINSSRIYTYDLHLNESGEVIDGKWKSRDRPDFIWIMPEVKNFEEYYSGLNELLK